MRELTPLCLLARKYESDKGGRHLRNGGRDNDSCHEYTPIYWDLLSAKRDRIRSVLEIGVDSGASLRMWREFFPQATVHGLDWCTSTLFDDDRIRCLYADQSSTKSLLDAVSRFKGPFDLIVDDGSHETEHQITSLRTLASFLSDDGVYVVEDLQSSCRPELVGQYTPDGFEWRSYVAEAGIGRDHCHCSECGGSGPERLVVVKRSKNNV